mmetsp:Transcript_30802/g.65522  ORF Transcript_30802/g.65522 Transcript_30802/m.65522 type:complete len:301 (+) Transcript_30802:181-1083(+)
MPIISNSRSFLCFAEMAATIATRNAPSSDAPTYTCIGDGRGPVQSSRRVVTLLASNTPGSSSPLTTERQCGPVYPSLHWHCLPVEETGDRLRKGADVALTHCPLGLRSGLDRTLPFASLASRDSSDTGGLSRPSAGSSSSSLLVFSCTFFLLSFFMCANGLWDSLVVLPFTCLPSSSKSKTSAAGCSQLSSTSVFSMPPPPQSSLTVHVPPPFLTFLRGCLSSYTNGGFLMYLYSNPLMNSFVGNSGRSQPTLCGWPEWAPSSLDWYTRTESILSATFPVFIMLQKPGLKEQLHLGSLQS